MRFKNILLVAGPVCDDKAALEQAAALARECGAGLAVVDVIDSLPRDLRMLITVVPVRELLDLAVKDRRDRLADLVRTLGLEEVRVKVRTGAPFTEIAREVQENGHDLVVTTPERKSRFKEQLFGSTSLNLLRKCPCPVLVLAASLDLVTNGFFNGLLTDS
jgi:nucleotide-binding universal stress UspA family protein